MLQYKAALVIYITNSREIVDGPMLGIVLWSDSERSHALYPLENRPLFLDVHAADAWPVTWI